MPAAPEFFILHKNEDGTHKERYVQGVQNSLLAVDAELLPFLKPIADFADASALGAHLADLANPHAVTKAQVGLPLVLNVAQIPASEKAAANGVATLDVNGKLAAAQIPASLVGGLSYQTAWNATTNTPAIPAASSGNKGWYYEVSVAGTTSIDGISSWAIGDVLISNGVSWDRIANTQAVTSVAGRTGAITVVVGDLAGLQTTLDTLAATAGGAATSAATANTGLSTLNGTVSSLVATVATKAPIESPNFTGPAQVGGVNIATVNTVLAALAMTRDTVADEAARLGLDELDLDGIIVITQTDTGHIYLVVNPASAGTEEAFLDLTTGGGAFTLSLLTPGSLSATSEVAIGTEVTLSGQTVGASNSETPVLVETRWYRDGTLVYTGDTYTIVGADHGHDVIAKGAWNTSVHTGLHLFACPDIVSGVDFAWTLVDGGQINNATLPASPAPSPAIEGQTLSLAGMSLSNNFGETNIGGAAQWYRDGAAISGATGTSYVVALADDGAVLTVKQYWSTSAHPTPVLFDCADDVTGAAFVMTYVSGGQLVNDTLAGDAASTSEVGQTLSVAAMVVTTNTGETPGVVGQRWRRDGTPIGGATGATYVILSADIGTVLDVQIGFTTTLHPTPTTWIASSTATTINPLFVYTVVDAGAFHFSTSSGSTAAIMGETATVTGLNVTANRGQTPVLLGIDWYVDAVLIGRSDSLSLLGSWVGSAVTAKAIYNTADFPAEHEVAVAGSFSVGDLILTRTTAGQINVLATSTIASSTEILPKTFTAVGQAVSTNNGETATLSGYQWVRDGVDISGSTGDITPTIDDAGHVLTVKFGWVTTSHSSPIFILADQSVTVSAGAAPGIPAFDLTGSNVSGGSISVSVSPTDYTDLLIEFLRNGGVVQSGVATSYDLGFDDVGALMTARATASNVNWNATNAGAGFPPTVVASNSGSDIRVIPLAPSSASISSLTNGDNFDINLVIAGSYPLGAGWSVVYTLTGDSFTAQSGSHAIDSPLFSSGDPLTDIGPVPPGHTYTLSVAVSGGGQTSASVNSNALSL